MRCRAGHDSSIEITSAIEADAYDLMIQVRVEHRAFVGAVETWVETGRWAAFLAAMGELERTRRGEATLEAMSPDVLRLTFRARDRAGHIVVDGSMSALEGTAQLTFGPLELDAGDMLRIVEELRALAPVSADRA